MIPTYHMHSATAAIVFIYQTIILVQESKMSAICQTHPCLMNERVWKQQTNTTSKLALLIPPTYKWILRCGSNITTSAPSQTTKFLLNVLYFSEKTNNNIIYFSALLNIFQWHYCNITKKHHWNLSMIAAILLDTSRKPGLLFLA